jgi:hypothetical protein
MVGALKGASGMTDRRLMLAFVIVVVLAACGGADDAGATSTVSAERSTSPTPAPATATTPAPATTTTMAAPTTTTGAPSTTATEIPAEPVTVETVVASIQRWLDDRFAASDPLEGVLGPIQLQCLDSGRLSAGDVFACAGIPQTDPDFPLDPVGVVVYVLDDTGAAAWMSGTDVPDTTAGLEAIHAATPKGMFCRDLIASDQAGWFGASAGTPEFGFFVSLLYWSLEGRPDRMDADGDGIPCETVFDADVIEEVFRGGPLNTD